MVTDLVFVEEIHELVRPIVKSESQNAHVVSVKDSMAESTALPQSHQLRRLDHSLFKEVPVLLRLVKNFVSVDFGIEQF